MKTKFFYGAFSALTLLALGSCSSDDDLASVGQDKQEIPAGEQIIVLDMQDTDVLGTRSRPLASTENMGAEQVTDVQLLVLKSDADGTYTFNKLLKPIPNWNSVSNSYNYGNQYVYKLEGNEKLTGNPGDKFIIYAVGQNEGEDNVIDPFKLDFDTDRLVGELTQSDIANGTIWNNAFTVGNGFVKTVPVDYSTAAGTHHVVGEIFSGVSIPISFTVDGGFKTTVLLKRQVAGVLGYFSNIPAYVGTNDSDAQMVHGIRLVATNRNNTIDLIHNMDIQTDDATHGQAGSGEEKAVNGFTADATQNAVDGMIYVDGATTVSDDAYTIYEINLTEWFKTETTAGGGTDWVAGAIANPTKSDGTTATPKIEQILGGSTAWKNPLDDTNSKIKVAAGSVLAGEFVIPFSKNTSATFTFELQLINKDGLPLKKWNVKLDSQSIVDGVDSESLFNIYRNHLYQIGKRGDTDSPNTPGGNGDEPQPLDKSQELIIKINDQWEFIHDMVIE